MSNLLNSLPVEDVNPVGVPRLQKDSDCPPEVIQGPFWAKNFLQNAEQFGKSRNKRILSLAHKLAELGHGLTQPYTDVSTFKSILSPMIYLTFP